MATIVLFHHQMGLTAGLRAFATRLRARGHQVLTPDLFGGDRFETAAAAEARRRRIGDDRVARRAAAAVAATPGPLVVVGVGMGVLAAKATIDGRDDVQRAIFVHETFHPDGLTADWPIGLPVQIHVTSPDQLASAFMLADVIMADVVEHAGDGASIDAGASDYDEVITIAIVSAIDDFIQW